MSEIVVIGDVHDERQRLAGVLELVRGSRPALALLTGDIGSDPPWTEPERETQRSAHDDSVRGVIGQVAAALGCPVVFVPGNHDLPRPLADSGGINCDGRWVEPAGLRIAGLGGSGPHHYGFPYEWSEHDAAIVLSRVLGDASQPPDVLLCHAPPAGTALDRTHRGEHVGSRAVREWIGVARPRLFVCGHIHEAWGMEQIDGVPCINAGALGAPHGEEIVWRIAWEAGAPSRIRSLRRREAGAIESLDWLGDRSAG